MKLNNLNAIVTGGANGIGRAIAFYLAEEGAEIIIADVEMIPANEAVAEIQRLGRKAMAIEVNVADSKDTERMADIALRVFGKIDILVNCAGGPNRINKLFHESNEEDWDRILNVNLKGTRNCTRSVINHMIDRKKGKIVNISSLAGILGDYGDVEYSAAKAGIIGLTMALAKEVACYGINVNCISPGPILTRAMLEHPERMQKIEKTTGLGRIGKPEEVAALVAFLASEDANFITGQNYPICGLRNLGVSV